MTGCKHSRKLLDCIEDNLLMQKINVLVRGDVSLDLLTTNKEKLIADVNVKGQPSLQKQ